jgi:hypothetical protein
LVAVVAVAAEMAHLIQAVAAAVVVSLWALSM